MLSGLLSPRCFRTSRAASPVLTTGASLNGIFWVLRSGAPWRDLSSLLPQTMLLADRGYDANWIGELVRRQGAWANIPPKRNRKDPICFGPHLYRARNLIERFFNKIKQCRRVATRYDKLAANDLAFIKRASIRIWLRANESAALNEQMLPNGVTRAQLIAADLGDDGALVRHIAAFADRQ